MCCPECGGPLHQCGQSVLRRELGYVPAQYKVAEHIPAAYICRCCEQENGRVPMKKSVVSPPLAPGQRPRLSKPAADLQSRSPAQVGPDFCNTLFSLEERCSKQGLSFERRQSAHAEQSVPTAKAFFVWAEAGYKKNPMPKGMLGAALTPVLPSAPLQKL